MDMDEKKDYYLKKGTVVTNKDLPGGKLDASAGPLQVNKKYYPVIGASLDYLVSQKKAGEGLVPVDEAEAKKQAEELESAKLEELKKQAEELGIKVTKKMSAEEIEVLIKSAKEKAKFEELKKQAKELDLEYAKNVTVEELEKLIAEALK